MRGRRRAAAAARGDGARVLLGLGAREREEAISWGRNRINTIDRGREIVVVVRSHARGLQPLRKMSVPGWLCLICGYSGIRGLFMKEWQHVAM